MHCQRADTKHASPPTRHRHQMPRQTGVPCGWPKGCAGRAVVCWLQDDAEGLGSSLARVEVRPSGGSGRAMSRTPRRAPRTPRRPRPGRQQAGGTAGRALVVVGRGGEHVPVWFVRGGMREKKRNECAYGVQTVDGTLLGFHPAPRCPDWTAGKDAASQPRGQGGKGGGKRAARAWWMGTRQLQSK